MYSLIIFGTGSGAEKVINSLNDNSNIIAFADNDKRKQNTRLNGISIIGAEDINGLNYDYVVIASQYNLQIKKQLIELKIDKNKIFDFYSYLANMNFIKDGIEWFKGTETAFDAIVTGISYTQNGFSSDRSNARAMKFCFASQDLFYDYHLVKYLLENAKEKMAKVKYVLIGISYYSFQYDMSLSSMKSRVKLYYDAIKLKHNLKDDSILKDDDRIDSEIADKLLKRNKNNSIEINWTKKNNVSNLKNKYEIGKVQAEKDCNKNYPGTVKENIQIINDYLKMLIDNNIKPIVVVFPASKYYTKYFSQRIENEFHSIIKDLQDKYEFQYIDYFRIDKFDDEDFVDVSHLSGKGATKFTQMLNEIIKW